MIVEIRADLNVKLNYRHLNIQLTQFIVTSYYHESCRTQAGNIDVNIHLNRFRR